MNTKSSPSLRLYLIRHGETEWSIDRRHTGFTDIPLTQNGENEARTLGEHLRNIPFARLLTSPLQRAQQTCALVGLNQAPELEPELTEWDYGDYEGKRSVDIRKERPDWTIFRDGCPQGEMPAQVSARADRLLTRLCKLDGNIALFSHAHFGSVLATRWIELAIVEAQHFPLGTASVSIFTFDSHHPTVPVIALLNATPHSLNL